MDGNRSLTKGIKQQGRLRPHISRGCEKFKMTGVGFIPSIIFWIVINFLAFNKTV